MHLLFPGRHHILTEFQYKYLFRIINATSDIKDIEGENLPKESTIDSVIFAVTSSNHSGTKRNPIPFYLRSMMIQDFASELSVTSYVFGIDDVGHLDDFAGYTLKTIAHQTDHTLDLNPENTWVICSTPVLDMYRKKGFRILPAELIDDLFKSYSHHQPWHYIELIANTENWSSNELIIEEIHRSSFKIFQTYQLGRKVRMILSDPIIGDDGDITETRNYNTYVRQMDDIALLKYTETAPFIKSGNIGDIGCAVGSWIKLACDDPRFIESDFYGIEVARQLFDICLQRKHNGEFKNPSVFFAMKNAVSNLVFAESSMNTIHTSSLTHEIESYGSREDLLEFIHNRHRELQPGGVWINRDVIGPENGDTIIFMKLNENDGLYDIEYRNIDNVHELKIYLESLSTYAKFIRFANDFRKEEGYRIQYIIHSQQTGNIIELKYRDAADFILTKDYTDNWKSEMHETFCFWSYSDWVNTLENSGFRVRMESKVYQNPWILENRWIGKVELFEDLSCTKKVELPPTNMLLVAEKIQ
ncbi:MAG: transferase [Cytophagaceae bacterium]